MWTRSSSYGPCQERLDPGPQPGAGCRVLGDHADPLAGGAVVDEGDEPACDQLGPAGAGGAEDKRGAAPVGDGGVEVWLGGRHGYLL